MWYQATVVYVKALSASLFDDDVAVEGGGGQGTRNVPGPHDPHAKQPRRTGPAGGCAGRHGRARLRECAARLIEVLMAEDRYFLSGALGAPYAGAAQACQSFAEAERAIENCYDYPNGCLMEAEGRAVGGRGGP